MDLDGIAATYKQINNKIKELRLLLIEQLIYYDVLDESILEESDLPSFFYLIHKVNPNDICALNTTDAINHADINTYHKFDTEEDIENFLYNSENSPAISQLNLMLINKFLYYYKYLEYQLEYMGVNPISISNASSLKELILLLKEIQTDKYNNPTYVLSELTYSVLDKNVEYNVIKTTDINNNELIEEIELDENTGNILITPKIVRNKNDNAIFNVVSSLSLDENGDIIVE